MSPLQWLFGGCEQIALLLFTVMLLAGLAGGNPSAVLEPLLQMIGRLLVGLASLACTLLGALTKALISLTPGILRSISGGGESASSRHIR